MMTEEDLFDVTIIGGGPTGCFALFYAGVRAMKAKLIEALPELGGQVTALYPEKSIFDMPGFPKILGRELSKQMGQQATQWDFPVCLGEKVTDLVRHDDTWQINTSRGEHLTRSILVCSGVGAFAPRRLGIEEIESMEGDGVYYNRPPDEIVKGKNVVIVGGGDSAVEWAIELADGIASSVTLIHRRDSFRAHEDNVNRLKASNVQVLLSHEVKGLCDHSKALHCVVAYHNRTHKETVLPCNVLLLGLGFVADVGLLKKWGLELEGNEVRVDTAMTTNLPGVFAAGDIVTYPGKTKLIATGTAEAAIAINSAKLYVDPSAKRTVVHSSEDPRFAGGRK
jgi:thioredoxin reductase